MLTHFLTYNLYAFYYFKFKNLIIYTKFIFYNCNFLFLINDMLRFFNNLKFTTFKYKKIYVNNDVFFFENIIFFILSFYFLL